MFADFKKWNFFYETLQKNGEAYAVKKSFCKAWETISMGVEKGVLKTSPALPASIEDVFSG